MFKFIEFLQEMATNSGSSYSLLNDVKMCSVKEKSYKDSLNWKVYNKFNVPENIIIKYATINNLLKFYTIDVKEKEVIHTSVLKIHNKDDVIKTTYYEQSIVDRIKDNRLPKYYATDFIYDYFKQSNIPLRSCIEQYTSGRDMWIRLVNKAFSDKFCVYFIDNKDIILLDTKEKINNAINDYFGIGNDFEHKHLLISKKELL